MYPQDSSGAVRATRLKIFSVAVDILPAAFPGLRGTRDSFPHMLDCYKEQFPEKAAEKCPWAPFLVTLSHEGGSGCADAPLPFNPATGEGIHWDGAEITPQSSLTDLELDNWLDCMDSGVVQIRVGTIRVLR